MITAMRGEDIGFDGARVRDQREVGESKGSE